MTYFEELIERLKQSNDFKTEELRLLNQLLFKAFLCYEKDEEMEDERLEHEREIRLERIHEIEDEEEQEEEDLRKLRNRAAWLEIMAPSPHPESDRNESQFSPIDVVVPLEYLQHIHRAFASRHRAYHENGFNQRHNKDRLALQFPNPALAKDFKALLILLQMGVVPKELPELQRYAGMEFFRQNNPNASLTHMFNPFKMRPTPTPL